MSFFDNATAGLSDGDVAISGASAPFYFSQLTRASRAIIWAIEATGDAINKTPAKDLIFAPVPTGSAPDGAPATGDEITIAPKIFRFASRSFYTLSSDTPANEFYDGRLAPVTISKTIGTGDGGAWSETVATEIGVITLANRDGALDALSDNYTFDGRQIIIKVAGMQQDANGNDVAPALVNFATVFVGEIIGWLATRDVVHIKVRDASAALDRPLAQGQYLGQGGSTGIEELAGVSKPITLGNCRNIPAVEIDRARSIYQVHISEIRGIDGVFDMGIPLERGVTAANYQELEALRTEGDVEETEPDLLLGQYAQCLLTGHIRLAGPPEGIVTADVRGDGGLEAVDEPWDDGTLWDDGTGWVENDEVNDLYVGTAGRIILRILRHYARIPETQIAATQIEAVDSELALEAGFYLEAGDNRTTCREAIATLAATMGCFLDRDNAGRYGLTRLLPPKTDPVLTIDEGMTQRDGGGSTLERVELPYGRPWPAWRVAYSRNWRQMDESEIAALASPVRRSFSLRRSNEIEVSDPITTLLHPERGFGYIDGVGISAGKAQTRALERLELYAPRRKLFRAQVKGIAFRLRLGDVVALEHSKYGLKRLKYLKFQATTAQYIEMGKASTFFSSTTSPFSVSLWAKWYELALGTQKRIFNIRSDDTLESFIMGASSSQIWFYSASVSFRYFYQSDAPANKWHHLCVTYDGTSYRWYLDGGHKGTVAGTHGGTSTSWGVKLGTADSHTSPHNGTLWDFRFYKSVLAHDQIKQLYSYGNETINASTGVALTSPQFGEFCHLDLQDLEDKTDVAKDKSGNANHGQMGTGWLSGGLPFEQSPIIRRFLVMGVQEDAQAQNTTLLLWG